MNRTHAFTCVKDDKEHFAPVFYRVCDCGEYQVFTGYDAAGSVVRWYAKHLDDIEAEKKRQRQREYSAYLRSIEEQSPKRWE
jgi:hypothetical protein